MVSKIFAENSGCPITLGGKNFSRIWFSMRLLVNCWNSLYHMLCFQLCPTPSTHCARISSTIIQVSKNPTEAIDMLVLHDKMFSLLYKLNVTFKDTLQLPILKSNHKVLPWLMQASNLYTTRTMLSVSSPVIISLSIKLIL